MNHECLSLHESNVLLVTQIQSTSCYTAAISLLYEHINCRPLAGDIQPLAVDIRPLAADIRPLAAVMHISFRPLAVAIPPLVVSYPSGWVFREFENAI